MPFRETFHDLPPVAFGPAPLQSGGPSLWVGGSSSWARQRAGRWGAAWHPVGSTVEAIREQAPLVWQAAAEVGRPRPEITPRLPLRFGRSGGPMTVGRAQVLEADPAAMVEHLAAYRQSGVAEIVCLFGSPDAGVVVEQMEILAAEVMPALAGD